MNFWMLILAIFVGLWLFELSTELLKVITDFFRNRREDRKIGFSNDSESKKKSKGAQMRKIGFGEGD